METKKKELKKAEKKSETLIAKKDWHVTHNEINVSIKAGEPVPELPVKILDCLRTEKVI